MTLVTSIRLGRTAVGNQIVVLQFPLGGRELRRRNSTARATRPDRTACTTGPPVLNPSYGFAAYLQDLCFELAPGEHEIRLVVDPLSCCRSRRRPHRRQWAGAIPALFVEGRNGWQIPHRRTCCSQSRDMVSRSSRCSIEATCQFGFTKFSAASPSCRKSTRPLAPIIHSARFESGGSTASRQFKCRQRPWRDTKLAHHLFVHANRRALGGCPSAGSQSPICAYRLDALPNRRRGAVCAQRRGNCPSPRRERYSWCPPFHAQDSTKAMGILSAQPWRPARACARAQESRRPTVRLKTGRSGVETGSGQK